MSHSGSKTVIYAAIVGNTAIAITKFMAAAITGSSSMFSEGIHSLVDIGNGLLLLFGIKQSLRPPDEEHPFGWGKELYFWSFIVAIMIFAVGGGISFYEGVRHVMHPEPMRNILWNYGVLGFSVCFESWSWSIAFKEFRKEKGDLGYLEAMQKSKAPTTFVIFIEDSAALGGLFIALLFITLGHFLHMPVLDGVGSIVIGLLLTGVAIFLAYETKGLLIGEAADPEVVADVRRICEADDAVEKFVRVRTVHFGPNVVLLAMDLLFKPKIPSGEVAKAIDRMEVEIRELHPQIKYIYLEAKAVATIEKD